MSAILVITFVVRKREERRSAGFFDCHANFGFGVVELCASRCGGILDGLDAVRERWVGGEGWVPSLMAVLTGVDGGAVYVVEITSFELLIEAC